MTLNVKKSQKGQYIRPVSKVGSRSRFNLATISFPLSPELEKEIFSQTLRKHTNDTLSPITYREHERSRIYKTLET